MLRRTALEGAKQSIEGGMNVERENEGWRDEEIG
jgi:hypothetical protein